MPDTPVSVEAARRFPLRAARRRDFIQGAVWADQQRAARVAQQHVDALLAEARGMVDISQIGEGARGVINDLAAALRELSKPST